MEKAGREGKQRTEQEIKSLFLNDLSAAAGQKVTYKEWDVDGIVTCSEPTSSVQPLTLDQQRDPVWVLANSGFKV
eukprot:8950435-Karenia_brevis.AAC.1